MVGTKPKLRKSKIPIVILLCLSSYKISFDHDQNLHFGGRYDISEAPDVNYLSNTRNVILFQENFLDAEHEKLIPRIQNDINKILNYPYLISYKRKGMLLNLEQTRRLQVNLLKEYFLQEMKSNIYYAELIRRNKLDIQSYKSQINKNLVVFNNRPENLDANKNSKPEFYESKGKLLLPTSGKIMKASGEPFASGLVPWDGVLISSQANEVVKSVGSGRVIFADSFIGFKAVVIIDHDDGYLSIYGNMEPIMVRLGQQIECGQAIGRVAKNNSLNFNGLYFEIRKAGSSLNSEQWFAN